MLVFLGNSVTLDGEHINKEVSRMKDASFLCNISSG